MRAMIKNGSFSLTNFANHTCLRCLLWLIWICKKDVREIIDSRRSYFRIFLRKLRIATIMNIFYWLDKSESCKDMLKVLQKYVRSFSNRPLRAELECCPGLKFCGFLKIFKDGNQDLDWGEENI